MGLKIPSPTSPCPRIHLSSPHTPGQEEGGKNIHSVFFYPITILHRTQSTLGCPVPTHPLRNLCSGPIPANFSSPQKANFLESAPPPPTRMVP